MELIYAPGMSEVTVAVRSHSLDAAMVAPLMVMELGVSVVSALTVPPHCEELKETMVTLDGSRSINPT